jgi:hypothetical protein
LSSSRRHDHLNARDNRDGTNLGDHHLHVDLDHDDSHNTGARVAEHHPSQPDDHTGCPEPEGASDDDQDDDPQERLDENDSPAGQLHERPQDQADGLYGETGSPSGYEEDHYIPLELGGAPKNPKNLWPEPHSQSKLSDPLETKLKRQVCKGLIKPAKARAAIRLFKNTQGCVARLRTHQPAITARDIGPIPDPRSGRDRATGDTF